MSDAYAREFEKWLIESKDEISIDEETDDDNHSEEEEYRAMEVEDEVEERQSANKSPWFDDQWRNKSSESLHDSAPILVDDDDEIFPSDNREFQDEPPVLELETVSKHNKTVVFRKPKFDSANTEGDYSCTVDCLNKSKSGGRNRDGTILMKTYSSKDKLDDKSDGVLNSKQSKEKGNIFDKFASVPEASEDMPPPLIPIPEALRLQSESPTDPLHDTCNSGPKHPMGDSPDFCAMEADSTSELSVGIRSNSFSKTSPQGDTPIECDSTCMLVGSPPIVSPASASGGDIDGQDQGGGGGGVSDVTTVDLESDVNSGCAGKTSKTIQVTQLTPSGKETSVTKGISIIELEHCATLMTSDNAMSDSYPVGPAVEDEVKEKLPTLPIIPSEDRSSRGRRNRKQRHTIDSAGSLSPPCKMPCKVLKGQGGDASGSHCEVSAPCHLTLESKGRVIKPSQCSVNSNIHNMQNIVRYHRKSTRRRNTIPAMRPISNISQDLQQFIQEACELSRLQSSLHLLIRTVFPQLRFELDLMTPESFRFESFMCDFIVFLQQLREDQMESKADSLKDCKQEKVASVYPLEFGEHSEKAELPSSGKVENCPCSDTGGVTVPRCMPLPSSSSLQHRQKTNPTGSKEPVIGDAIIPKLTQLSLACHGDKALELRPVSVCLHRDPNLGLLRFAQMSYSVLQLLLPTLSVSFFEEISQSPQDLLVFIDNVIRSNCTERDDLNSKV